MKDNLVDEMIAELDKEKTGFIEIEQFAKVSFNIKEEKSKDDKKDKAKKKWRLPSTIPSLLLIFKPIHTL